MNSERRQSKTRKKAVIQINNCVACGCCAAKCPRSAIEIKNGVYAYVNNTRCVGCGLCKAVCPASVIQIAEVPA